MHKSLLLTLIVSSLTLVSCTQPVSYLPGGLEPIAQKDLTSEITTGSGKNIVTVFVDFQCPGCQAFHREVLGYVEGLAQSGAITLEKKNYPLDGHPSAYKDALAALCAASVGKYSEYSDALYAHETKRNQIGAQKIINPTSTLALLGQDIGINGEKMAQCIDEKWYESTLKEQMKQAETWRITGTPSVYINGTLIKGVSPADLTGYQNILS